jgi:chitinase
VSFTSGVFPEAAGRAIFHVALDAPAEQTVRMTLWTAKAGAAQPGQDFRSVRRQLRFPPGQTQLDVAVPVRDDAVYEGDETFTGYLALPPGVLVSGGANEALATIVDDEQPPRVTVRDLTFRAGRRNRVAKLRAELSGRSAMPVSVHYVTADGTARAGYDYMPAAATLTFKPGQTRQTVAVTILPATSRDWPFGFTFHLQLTEPVNATLENAGSNVNMVQIKMPIPDFHIPIGWL